MDHAGICSRQQSRNGLTGFSACSVPDCHAGSNYPVTGEPLTTGQSRREVRFCRIGCPIQCVRTLAVTHWHAGNRYRTGPGGSRSRGFSENNRLNKQDAERLEMGYYEGLLAPNSFTSVLWTIQAKTPKDWVSTRESGVTIDTNNILLYELVASYDAMFKRAKLHTNS